MILIKWLQSQSGKAPHSLEAVPTGFLEIEAPGSDSGKGSSGGTGAPRFGPALANRNNSCFLISDLQFLFHMPGFVSWINDTMYEIELTCTILSVDS
jgi:hypothetical protein